MLSCIRGDKFIRLPAKFIKTYRSQVRIYATNRLTTFLVLHDFNRKGS